MIYFLLVLLIILFFVSYLFSGKDIAAPSTMLAAGFLFSTMCAVYKVELWGISLGETSVIYIISALFISIAANGMIHTFFRKRKIRDFKESITPISSAMTMGALLVLAFSCVALLYHVVKIANTSGAFDVIMQAYRAKNAYSTDSENQLPTWLREVLNFSNSLCYVFLFNAVYFWRDLDKKHKIENLLVIVLSIISSLATGGRFSSMGILIAAFIMYYLIQTKRNGKYKVFRIKSIFKFIVIVLIILYGFYIVKGLVGRESEDGIIEYITHYAGGGIPGFDLYLKNPPKASDIIGKETFYSLINNLNKLNIIDVPYYYIHHEFRISNGVSIGNIYTALRDYHYDFGVVGMFLLHTIFSFLFSYFYERVKHRGTVVGTIVFSMTYYCVVLYTISNYFFANILSIGFVIKIVFVYLLCEILLKKKIGIRIR